MPLAPSLQQFVDTELGRAALLIESAVRDVQSLLRTADTAGANLAERTVQAELASRLQRHAAAYRDTFIESLTSRVRAELARAHDESGHGMAPPSGLGGLTLMDESRVEIDIEISRATQLIDAAAEWELRELQTFTSTLIGQAHVSAESNPLRPMLYAAALWDAACVVDPSPARRAVLLRLSSIACAPLLKNSWAAASTRLEADGIAPGAYRSRVLPSGTARAMRDDPADADASGALRQLLAALPGTVSGVQTGAERFAAPPAVAPLPMPVPGAARAAEAALARLDDILRELPAKTLSKLQATALSSRLATHREAFLASGAPRADGPRVVDLLSRVFDALLADPELHPSFMAVVARLQIPALRLAVRDPASLTSTVHPVWQLLDRIGQASATYPHASDRRGTALLTLCGRLTDELIRQHGADADLCRKALGKLDEFLDAQLQAQCRIAEPRLRQLRDAERLATLQQEVAQRLEEQMTSLNTSPDVRRFLRGPWAHVVAKALLDHAESEEPARGYIRFVDDLLWSVHSPDHPASRQRLAGLLPGMMRCLDEGMTSICLAEAEQQAIRVTLGSIHAAALRGDEPPVPPPTATDVEPPRRPAEPSMIDETAAIDVASLETVPAELLPTSVDAQDSDAPARQVAGLRVGDRLRMFVNGRWARVQALWRSDRGEAMLFAGEAVGDTHAITRRALEKLAAAGLLRPIEDLPLSRRAFETVERRLARAAA